MAHILVVEDQRRIGALLAGGLRKEGFAVRTVATGEEALETLERDHTDLVLLDLMLPAMDGLSVLDWITARCPELPVVVVSARRDLETRLDALRSGASDFVQKPFSYAELVERIKIHLTKTGHPVSKTTIVQLGGLILDIGRREVDVGDGPVPLTDREFHLLRRLVQARGSIVSRERLLAEVWDFNFVPHTNALDVCVKRLRDKIGRDTIATVRSAGYRVVVNGR